MAAEQSHTQHGQAHLAVNEEGGMCADRGPSAQALLSLLSFTNNTRPSGLVLDIYVSSLISSGLRPPRCGSVGHSKIDSAKVENPLVMNESITELS